MIDGFKNAVELDFTVQENKDKMEAELKDLETKTMQEGFWNDSKASSKVLSRIKQLKSKEKLLVVINY